MKTNFMRLGLTTCMIVLAFSFTLVGCKDDNDPKNRWKFIGNILDELSDSSISVFIDQQNIVVNDQTRTFWVKYIAIDTKSDPPKEFERQVGYWEVNCFDRTLIRLAEEYYDEDGNLIGQIQERLKEEYSSKDTIGAKMAAAACRYAGK